MQSRRGNSRDADGRHLSDALLEYGHLNELKLNIEMSYRLNSLWTLDRWSYHFFQATCEELKKHSEGSEKHEALVDLLANRIPPKVCAPANQYYLTFLDAALRCDAPVEVLRNLIEVHGCLADQTIYYPTGHEHPSNEGGALATHLQSASPINIHWEEIADLLIRNSRPLKTGKIYCARPAALSYLKRRADMIVGQSEEFRVYGGPMLLCAKLTRLNAR
jgi:hypothetical protein